jgi:hypothetical protein
MFNSLAALSRLFRCDFCVGVLGHALNDEPHDDQGLDDSALDSV